MTKNEIVAMLGRVFEACNMGIRLEYRYHEDEAFADEIIVYDKTDNELMSIHENWFVEFEMVQDIINEVGYDLARRK